MCADISFMRLSRARGYIVSQDIPRCPQTGGQLECLICLEKLQTAKFIAVKHCFHWVCVDCEINYNKPDCPLHCEPKTQSDTESQTLVHVDHKICKKFSPHVKTENILNEVELLRLENTQLKTRLTALEQKLETFTPFNYVTWEDFHKYTERPSKRVKKEKSQ